MTLVCFHQHRLTCIHIRNAKRVLIDGSKGIFKFGILGNTEHRLLSLLGFLCPSVQELGFIQALGVGVLPQECFLRPGSPMSSFLELENVIVPCKWPLRGSCFSVEMTGILTNTNVSIFFLLANQKEPPLHTELLASLLSPCRLSHLL